jgi:integrase
MVRVHITPVLGQVPLAALTAEMVDQFLAVKAEASLARTHISRMRTVLADALRHAERRGLIVRNVAALAVMLRTKPPTARRSFTPAEAVALLAAAEGERLDAMVVVGLAVGLRPGELTGLLWPDLDLDATHHRPAAPRRRRPPLPPEAPAHQEHRRGSAVAGTEPGVLLDGGYPAQPVQRAANLRPYRQTGRHQRRRLPVPVTSQRRFVAAGRGSRHREVADLLGDDPRTPYRHYRHKVRPVADLATRMESILAGVDGQATAPAKSARHTAEQVSS